MATLTVYGSVADGDLWGQSTTYSIARSTVSALEDEEDIAYVGQNYYGGTYSVYESFFKYDTSSLSGATVTAVQEKLYVNANGASTGFTDQCRSKDWGESLTSADWVAGDDLSSLTLLSSLDVTIATSGIVTFPSSSNFVAAVDTEGYTYTLHCSSRHVAGNSPSGNEFIGWGTADYSGTDNDPRLYIEYDDVAQITPTGIASAEAFGSPSVLPGAVAIQPSGIASAEAFGSPSVLPGAVAIQPTGIASAEAFGSPILAWISYKKRAFLGWVASASPRSRAYIGWDVSHLPFIYPTGIASAEAFGSPSVKGFYVLQPSGIASAEAFGTAAVVPVAVLVMPDGIGSQEAFGSPFVRLEPVPVLMSGKCYIHLVTGGLVLLQPILKGEVRIR